MRTAALLLLLLAAPAGAAFDHSHAAWGRVLDARWREGLVDYEGLHADPSDLDSYLDAVASVEEGEYTSWTPQQRLAFWINAYNAFSVKAVVDHYPLKRPWWRARAYKFPANSARQIERWEALNFTAAKQAVTLGEARALALKLSDDPRLALALSCSCRGGPGLPGKPFTAETLDEQLEEAARAFVSNPMRLRLDSERRAIAFAPALRELGGRAFALRYARPEQAKALEDPDWTVEYLPQDWSLDELGAREAGQRPSL